MPLPAMPVVTLAADRGGARAVWAARRLTRSLRTILGSTVGVGFALATPLAAYAQSGAGRAESEQHRGENGSGGDNPIDVTLNYASDLDANVTGGQSRGLDYLDRVSVLFDADLDKLVGLHGATAHLSVYQIHGIGLSGRHVGNLLLVSGLEAKCWFRGMPPPDSDLMPPPRSEI